MKRALTILATFVLTLIAVSFLPLFIERTFMRSWRIDRLGDEITWGWNLISLYGYWSDYAHLTREQNPEFWLRVNLALAGFYAVMISLGADRVLIWRRRQAGARSS